MPPGTLHSRALRPAGRARSLPGPDKKLAGPCHKLAVVWQTSAERPRQNGRMKLALTAAAALAVLTASAAGCQTARPDPDSVPATGPGSESSTAQSPPASDSAPGQALNLSTTKQPSAPTTAEAADAEPSPEPGRDFGEVWRTSNGRLLGQWNWVPIWFKHVWYETENFPAIMAIDETRLVAVRPSAGQDVVAYIFDSTTGAVTMAAPSGFNRREAHSIVWTGRHVLIGSGRYNHSHSWLTYDPADDVWEELTVDRLFDSLPELSDEPRLNRSVGSGEHGWREPNGVWNGSEVLFPHESLRGLALNPYRGTWRTLAAGPLSQRKEPIRVWTGQEFIVWGGCDFFAHNYYDCDSDLEKLRDGAIYEPVTDTWRTIAPSPLPDATAIAAVWAGTEIFYYTSNVNTGVIGAASYDPTLDEWTLLPTPPFGSPYNNYSLAWSSTSNLVLAWGGNHVSDGAAYDLSTKTWLWLPDAPRNSAVRKNAIGRTGYSIATIGNTFYIDGGHLMAGWSGGGTALGALTLSPHPHVYARQE